MRAGCADVMLWSRGCSIQSRPCPQRLTKTASIDFFYCICHSPCLSPTVVRKQLKHINERLLCCKEQKPLEFIISQSHPHMESCFKFSLEFYMCIKSLLKIVLNKYPCFVNKWILWWWQRLKVEAISGCLSVRRHARTCWRAARLIVRLWEVNEKTGNLLKFHFHPLRSHRAVQQR